MTSQRTNAALMRLKHAINGFEFNDILKEILEQGEGVAQALEIVKRQIEGGGHVLTDQLAEIISRTKSSDLYEKVKKQLFVDDWALLMLYKNQYPDIEIEAKLCDRLYQTSTNDAEPRRRYIADAIQAAGTESALPTLEAILFDLKPTVQVKKILSNALRENNSADHEAKGERFMLRLEASSRARFLESVAFAIDAIKGRYIAGKPHHLASQAESLQVDEISSAEKLIEQAFGNPSAVRGGPQAVQDTLTIADLIAAGEREDVEFKSTLRMNRHTGQPDDKIQMAALKTVAAFLNTGGGTLLIGVSDDGSIVGLSADGFANEDKMSLHLVNLIRDRIGVVLLPYVHLDFVQHDGFRILSVRCERGQKPAYVKDGSTPRFFIRGANATIELDVPSVVDYISQRFK